MNVTQKLRNFLNNLGLHHPNNLNYYLQAITHSSYTNEINSNYPSYDRLEFLGDDLVKKIISEHLFRLPNNLSEGDMSENMNKLIQESLIAKFAREIKLDQQILVGKSIQSLSYKTLSHCFKALIAAIYLDQKGEDFVRELINKTLLTRI
ncbi:Ribonuclease III, RNase III domain-containing protein [[Mycoplasma] cavipharyngis]|uniref:ribonuclease III domain-containing protein n=1 Tax=[Mycoplasma] cavipharyngis TaxID=92757 RepID=UPI003704074A